MNNQYGEENNRRRINSCVKQNVYKGTENIGKSDFAFETKYCHLSLTDEYLC